MSSKIWSDSLVWKYHITKTWGPVQVWTCTISPQQPILKAFYFAYTNYTYLRFQASWAIEKSKSFLKVNLIHGPMWQEYQCLCLVVLAESKSGGGVGGSGAGAAGRRRDFLRPSWQGKSTKNHAAAAARAAKEEHTYEVKEFQNQDQDGPGSAV